MFTNRLITKLPKVKTKLVFYLLSVICTSIIGQTTQPTNLDIINSLIDKSMKNIISGLPFEDITYSLKFESAPEYVFMENRANTALSKLVAVTDRKDKALYNVSYTIEEISASYINPEKDGLFGSYYVTRNILLKGSYILSSKGVTTNSDSFALTSSDTVAYDSLSELETMTLPFTRGKKPDEPFFASLLEPAIAVGAIAVTIILFFTVRSN